MKRKKPARQKEEDFHHNVYVILLKDAVAKHPSILRLNPKRDPLKPCVYVGMTGIPVDHRFENHKNGYKSAWVVRKYGVRLMPELYEHLNPMPFEAAVQMETELAEELRTAGYTVTGRTLKGRHFHRVLCDTSVPMENPHEALNSAATVFLDLIARIVLTNGKRFLHTGRRKSGF